MSCLLWPMKSYAELSLPKKKKRKEKCFQRDDFVNLTQKRESGFSRERTQSWQKWHTCKADLRLFVSTVSHMTRRAGRGRPAGWGCHMFTDSSGSRPAELLPGVCVVTWGFIHLVVARCVPHGKIMETLTFLCKTESIFPQANSGIVLTTDSCVLKGWHNVPIDLGLSRTFCITSL